MGNYAIASSEKAQEHAIGAMARALIARRDEVRLILVGGPSSAGKTTFAKRLAHHLERNGSPTLSISTDDYFVGDALNPRDENGNLDYEHIRAMDLYKLNDNLVDLVAGREAILPRFDFQRHMPMEEGFPARLGEGAFVIVEGLHSLNPELTPRIPAAEKAIIMADTSTDPFAGIDGAHFGDQRLIRRIIRDKNYRNRSAAGTIGLWESVRAGEERWIRPFVGYAQETFDTTLPYEPAVLRLFALPLLQELFDNPEVADTARRLAGLLELFEPIEDATPIPSYSILREYIGGSSIQY